jgi:predicted O-methyltransferase YrrM
LKLRIDPETVKGFLDPEEAAALYRHALAGAKLGPCLEIGAYCGRSALYLGAACEATGSVLYSLDHHRGSEENQPGCEWHDPETWDAEAGAMDTLPSFRRNMRRAGLEETVIALVGRAPTIAKHWRTPLGLLFIDGGHGREHAYADYRGWTPFLLPGGLLAIHDVFPNPADGGRPPFEIYSAALASEMFEEIDAVKSLRVLRRL